MIVLGISPLDKDATVALMVNGRVAHAVAEERLSRRKMHTGFPHRALEMVLKLSGVTPDEVDHVMYAFFDWETESRMMQKNLASDWRLNRGARQAKTLDLVRRALDKVPSRDIHIPGLTSPAEKMNKPFWKRFCYRLAAGDSLIGDLINHRQYKRWIKDGSKTHRNFQEELLSGLRKFGLEKKLERVEHHQTHVANAFYSSGFKRALVVTVDAYGSGLSATISTADDTGIRRLTQIETPTSMGEMYAHVTSALGFDPDRHAGKIVGLAAYGDPEILGDVLRNLFEWDDSDYCIRRSSDVYFTRYLSTLFPKIDVAAAYQRVLEEVVSRHVKFYVRKTSLDTVVLSGGVAANVKLNQRIHEISGVRNLYIHPAMGDGGCSVGAAALKVIEHGILPEKIESVFLGPEYSEEEYLAAIRSAGLSSRRCDDMEMEIARLVAGNHVVARFDGPMEYGPRALGNRSILYPAIEPNVNQWLNERLGRTEFMPFAPATLYEDRDQCYENIEGAEFAAQFMTITFDCTLWMREHCPAAVHVDGTARPQLVTESSNPSFYRVLRHYKSITGLPSMINTSFNMHEEPIVCTPDDAIRAFQLGRLDYMAMGNLMVSSTERSSTEVIDHQVSKAG